MAGRRQISLLGVTSHRNLLHDKPGCKPEGSNLDSRPGFQPGVELGFRTRIPNLGSKSGSEFKPEFVVVVLAGVVRF